MRTRTVRPPSSGSAPTASSSRTATRRAFHRDARYFLAPRECRRPADRSPARLPGYAIGQAAVQSISREYYELTHPGPLAQIAKTLRCEFPAPGSVPQGEPDVRAV